MTARRRRISQPEMSHLLAVQCTVASHDHSHTNNIKGPSRFRFCMCVCMCVCTTIIIKKEAINLRVGEYRKNFREGNWEGLEGRKEGEKVM